MDSQLLLSPSAIQGFSRIIAVGLKHLLEFSCRKRPRGIRYQTELDVELSMEIHVLDKIPRWEVKRDFVLGRSLLISLYRFRLTTYVVTGIIKKSVSPLIGVVPS